MNEHQSPCVLVPEPGSSADSSKAQYYFDSKGKVIEHIRYYMSCDPCEHLRNAVGGICRVLRETRTKRENHADLYGGFGEGDL